MINIEYGFYLEAYSVLTHIEPGSKGITASILEWVVKEQVSIDNDCALLFNSPGLQDIFLENALASLDKEGLEFFNPLMFTGSIVNSITAGLNKKLGLTLYANSYASSSLYPLFTDFTCLNYRKALCIHVVCRDNLCFTEIFLLNKRKCSPGLVVSGITVPGGDEEIPGDGNETAVLTMDPGGVYRKGAQEKEQEVSVQKVSTLCAESSGGTLALVRSSGGMNEIITCRVE